MSRAQCRAFIRPLDFYDLFKSKAIRLLPNVFFFLFFLLIFFVQGEDTRKSFYAEQAAIISHEIHEFKQQSTFAFL